ncbi:hypothetical protein [Lactobacillus psittaci]|nr:hypothetical protein [Lactobacillus psittaci]
MDWAKVLIDLAHLLLDVIIYRGNRKRQEAKKNDRLSSAKLMVVFIVIKK